MSLHPFYKAVYGFSALHTLLVVALATVVLSGLSIGDGSTILNYQLRLFLAFAGLRGVANVVFENILMKHSAVFRSMTANDQRTLVMSVTQFTSLISWSGTGMLIAFYAPFNTLSSNQQILHPLGQALTFACIMDLNADLFRNPSWDVYIHHGIALLMLVVSFEILPVSMSDPGTLLYSMQNGLDRFVRLLLFWSKMRRQQVVLLAKRGSMGEISAKNNASLDQYIPSDASLKHQFTVAIVVYTFGVRAVMISAVGAYLYSAWDDMIWGWRITHVSLPVAFALTDIKFWYHMYRKSSLA